jgi:hypothetical protein
MEPHQPGIEGDPGGRYICRLRNFVYHLSSSFTGVLVQAVFATRAIIIELSARLHPRTLPSLYSDMSLN